MQLCSVAYDAHFNQPAHSERVNPSKIMQEFLGEEASNTIHVISASKLSTRRCLVLWLVRLCIT